MARANIRTWLPLDEFAQIIGISPLSFNQLHSNTLQLNTTCGETFFQYDWQHSDRVGRETIAQAIRQAETDIAREVGYNLMPDWTLDERLPYPRPNLPEGFGNSLNNRGLYKSVEATRGHMISGGVRAKSLIAAVAPVVRSDVDGDGYSETCTVTVAITITDTNEVHVYYAGKAADDTWEIRPIKVAISGGFATITFNSWQIPLATKLEYIDPQPLDADLAASYETTVDVYRVYNDPSTQVSFMWENDPSCSSCCGTCLACQFGTQVGCFHTRDDRMGFIVPSPASWNASTSQFDSAEWSACREPDKVRVWYYSGWRDMQLTRPYAELAPEWKYTIAYYAASKFDRDVCGCSNVKEFIHKWKRDAAYSNQEEGGFTLTAEQAANRLGTSMGALYAYRQIQRPGVRINK